MSDKVEKLYSKLKAKHKSLPDFRKLDSDFELTSIKDENVNERYFSRVVRRRVYEKMYYFNSALVSIIQPQAPSIVLAHESKFLTNEDREEIFKVIRKLTKSERKHILLEIEYDEDKDVEFIRESFDLWLEVRPVITRILNLMKTSWDKEENFKTGDYFG